MEILNINEFDVLVSMESDQDRLWDTEKEKKKLHISTAVVEKSIQKLTELGFIEKVEGSYKVSKSAYRYLEQHRVERAILLAAGFGSRMKPVTLTTPKPLVKVNGRRIIETLLDAILAKGIKNITIVTGYLSDEFHVIKEKYPNIRFIYNENYSTQNNISSAMLVRDHYANSYIMDADLYLKNPDLIRKYEYHSNYLGIYVPETDDWCLKMDGERAVDMVQGGTDTYLMVGLSYWSPKDGTMFSRDIEKLYETEEGKQKYWDDVALTEYNEHYDLHVRECDFDDIIEIDSIQELAAIDPSYKKYVE